MSQNIYCLAVFTILNTEINNLQILSFFSPFNDIKQDEFKKVFSNKNFNIRVNQLSSFEYQNKVWSLIANEQSIIFCVVTKIEYAKRLVSSCLNEMSLQYGQTKYTTQTTQFIPVLKKLYDKYNNPESFDSLSKVNNKIEQTKFIMQENIEQSLANTIKLETIELKSEELQQSAGIFRYNAKELKNKMWWKNMKMKLMIGSVIAIILIIIITVCVEMSKNSNN